MKLLHRCCIAAILLVMIFGVNVQSSKALGGPIYWGAYIKGSTYGLSDAPWNTTTIDKFESHAGKKISILHWGQPWWNCTSSGCGYQYFQTQQTQFQAMRNRGIIPLVDWSSWDLSATSKLNQPKFSLAAIIRGDHDAYIRQWASQAKAWGHPFFLRFDWEMNGSWFPWSEKVNGNSAGQYVKAWRHIHDIFTNVGAKNVTWVWCPNILYSNAIPLDGLYPGGSYVDWTCMDGYNHGTNPTKPDKWHNFKDMFTPTYNALLTVAPAKPIMIGETASTEYGGSKAAWITNAFTTYLPTNFPKIKAVLWFNWNCDGMDWVIETSSTAQSAFAKAIASPYYAKNDFANISVSPIPPLAP
jgi:hypothetical protein